MKAAIILKNADFKNFISSNYDIVIGADKGALEALKHNISLDIAIGDFDSVSNDELDLIKYKSKKVIKLNPIKDSSDTHEALELVKDYDEVEILGGISGKRIEHFISNLIDLSNYPNVALIDENSRIETLIPNKNYNLKKEYKFISFFSITNESIITLEGFKYPLKDYVLKSNDSLCLSNEMYDNAKLTLKEGKILIIYSKAD